MNPLLDRLVTVGADILREAREAGASRQQAAAAAVDFLERSLAAITAPEVVRDAS